MLEARKAFSVIVIPQEEFIDTLLTNLTYDSGLDSAIGATWLLAFDEFITFLIEILGVSLALLDNLVTAANILEVVRLIKDDLLRANVNLLPLNLIADEWGVLLYLILTVLESLDIYFGVLLSILYHFQL